MIVAVLFAVPDDASVDELGALCIALLGVPVPLAIGLMHLADWVFLLWVRVRKFGGWLAFWIAMLRVMRRVGQTDEIRAAWLARRENNDRMGEHLRRECPRSSDI